MGHNKLHVEALSVSVRPLDWFLLGIFGCDGRRFNGLTFLAFQSILSIVYEISQFTIFFSIDRHFGACLKDACLSVQIWCSKIPMSFWNNMRRPKYIVINHIMFLNTYIELIFLPDIEPSVYIFT